MRYFYLLVLTGLVGLGVYAVVSWPKTANQQSATPTISLVNLPERYCPAFAEVLAASNLSTTLSVPITNCRSINLFNLSLTGNDTLFLWLPQALPLSIAYTPLVDRYIISPRIGDVNSDNVIDELDEDQVIGWLFTQELAGDVDLDNHVTSEDLALVRLNYGVGEKRPDKQEWRR